MFFPTFCLDDVEEPYKFMTRCVLIVAAAFPWGCWRDDSLRTGLGLLFPRGKIGLREGASVSAMGSLLNEYRSIIGG